MWQQTLTKPRQVPKTYQKGGGPADRKREEKDEGKNGLTSEQKERIEKNREADGRKKRGVEIEMHPIHQQWCKDERNASTRGGYKVS